MKTLLKDEVPVQKNYNHISKLLHIEIKEYVADLLNRGWIVPPESNYSSLVVAVRKKDGNLRLCCYYRALNVMTYPDRHPLPNI